MPTLLLDDEIHYLPRTLYSPGGVCVRKVLERAPLLKRVTGPFPSFRPASRVGSGDTNARPARPYYGSNPVSIQLKFRKPLSRRSSPH